MKRGNNRSKKNNGGLKKYKTPIIVAITVVVMAISIFYIARYIIFRAIYKQVGAAAGRVTRLVETDVDTAGVDKLLGDWEEAERDRQHKKRSGFRRNVQMLKDGIKKEQQTLAQKHLKLIEETMSTTRDQIKEAVGKQIVETFKMIKLEQAKSREDDNCKQDVQRDELAAKQMAFFEQKISDTLDRVSKQVNQNFTKLVLENKKERVGFEKQLKEDKKNLEEKLIANQKSLEIAQKQNHEILAMRLIKEQEVLKTELRDSQRKLKDEEKSLQESFAANQKALERAQKQNHELLATRLIKEQEVLKTELRDAQRQLKDEEKSLQESFAANQKALEIAQKKKHEQLVAQLIKEQEVLNEKHELLAARLVGEQQSLKDEIKYNQETIKARIVGEQVLFKEMVAKKQQSLEDEISQRQAMLTAKLTAEQMKLREKLEQNQQLLTARLTSDQENVSNRLVGEQALLKEKIAKGQNELREALTAQLIREQMTMEKRIDRGHKLLVNNLKDRQKALSVQNYDRLRGELVASKDRMQKDVTQNLMHLKEKLLTTKNQVERDVSQNLARFQKELLTTKDRLERDTTQNFMHLKDEIVAAKKQVQHDVTQNLAHIKSDVYQKVEALRLADYAARELEEQKLVQAQKELSDKHLGLIQEKLSVSDEQMRRLVAENESYRRKQEVSSAARVEAFKACLMSAEDRSQKRIAKLQDNLRKDAEKKLVSAMSTYQEQSVRELEDWKRLRNSYVDQAAKHRERQLELFDVRLASAKDKMATHVGEELKLIAQASQKEREKHQEDLSKRYVSLFNISLQSAEKKVVANVGNKFKVLAVSSEEKMRRNGEMLKEKYLQLFDVKLASAQDAIKKQAEDKIQLLAVENRKSREDEMRQGRLALQNVAQDHLETFQKRLDVSKDAMTVKLGKNIKEMSARDMKERQRSYNGLVSKHMKLLEGKIVQMQAKLEKKHIGMFSEHLKVAQSQVGEKQSALLKEKFSSEVANLKLFAQGKLKEIAQTEEDARQVGYQKLLDKQLQVFNEKLVDAKWTLKSKMEEKLKGVAAQARLERHWEKEDQNKKQEALSKEYLEIFNIQLACAKDSIKGQAGKQLQELMEKDSVKWGQEQQALSKKYFTLFESKLSTTQDQVKGEIDENFKRLSLIDAQKRTEFEEQRRKDMERLAAKHLRAFDEKMIQTEQKIRTKAHEKFNELADMGYKEIVDTGEKQFVLFDQKLKKIQDQVGGQAREQFNNIIVAHKQEIKVQRDDFAKKQLAEFDKRLMAMQSQLEQEAEKKLSDVVLVVSRIGEFAQENTKQLDDKLLMVKNEVQSSARAKLGEIADKVEQIAVGVQNDRLDSKTKMLAMKEEVESSARAKLGEIADKVEQIAVGVQDERQQLRAEIEKRDALAAKQSVAIDSKLLAVQKEVEASTRTRLASIADKVEQIAVGVQDERQQLRAEIEKRDALAAKQSVAIDSKLLAVQKEVEASTRTRLASIADKVEKIAVDVEGERRSRHDELLARQEKLLDTKLVAVRQEFALQTQKKIKEFAGEIYQAAVQAQSKGNDSRQEFVRKQEALLQEKIAAVRENMQQQFKTLLQEEEAKRVAARGKQKQVIESLTGNMLQAIEARLAASSTDRIKQNNGELESLVEKLKNVTHSQSAQLRELGKKLEKTQKEKMAGNTAIGELGKAISQEEIDALVKKEVDKQLSTLRSKKDPRRSRLKKVVALEKMRRLVNSLAEGNNYENAIEF